MTTAMAVQELQKITLNYATRFYGSTVSLTLTFRLKEEVCAKRLCNMQHHIYLYSTFISSITQVTPHVISTDA